MLFSPSGTKAESHPMKDDGHKGQGQTYRQKPRCDGVWSGCYADNETGCEDQERLSSEADRNHPRNPSYCNSELPPLDHDLGPTSHKESDPEGPKAKKRLLWQVFPKRRRKMGSEGSKDGTQRDRAEEPADPEDRSRHPDDDFDEFGNRGWDHLPVGAYTAPRIPERKVGDF